MRAPEFISGEAFCYLGRRYQLKLSGRQKAPLQFDGTRFILRQDAQSAEQHFRDWYIETGTPWLRRRVEMLSVRTGGNPKRISVRDLGFRWGSCGKFNPDRPKFKGKTRLDGTAAENKAVVRATAVNFGTWSVNEADKTLTVHQEANIFPNDDGLDVKRTIALAGDELKVTNPNPSSGGTAMSVWRRVKLAN